MDIVQRGRTKGAFKGPALSKVWTVCARSHMTRVIDPGQLCPIQDSIKPNESSVIESSRLSSGFGGGGCVRMLKVTICICKAFAWMATGKITQSKQGLLRNVGKLIASPSTGQYWHHQHTL